MDSNIRIITGLIMQEMQNYIYNESMYLVQVETSLTHRVKILISGMAVLLLATLGILMRRSFRLTGGIIRPVTEMLGKVKKVGRGNFDVLPVSAEIVEIEELDQGINKDQWTSGKCPAGKGDAASDRTAADPGTGQSAFFI